MNRTQYDVAAQTAHSLAAFIDEAQRDTARLHAELNDQKSCVAVADSLIKDFQARIAELNKEHDKALREIALLRGKLAEQSDNLKIATAPARPYWVVCAHPALAGQFALLSTIDGQPHYATWSTPSTDINKARAWAWLANAQSTAKCLNTGEL